MLPCFLLFVLLCSFIICTPQAEKVYNEKSGTFGEQTLTELKKYGEVASNYRYVINSIKKIDLKVYFQINISSANPTEAMVSVVRIDNMTVNKEKKRNVVHQNNPQDRLWRDIEGWPTELKVDVFVEKEEEGVVKVDNSDVQGHNNSSEHMNQKNNNNSTSKKVLSLVIPRNPSSDLLQFVIKNHPFSTSSSTTSSTTAVIKRDIPKVIFQMGGDLKGQESPVIRKAMMLLKMQNPSYKHIVVSLEEMSNFIEKNEGPAVRRLFDTIKPIAYKSDIFRLVALYRFGGVYLDSKMISVRPLDDVLPLKGPLLVAERWKIKGFQSAFMASSPGHPFFRMAIDRIMENIKTKNYSSTSISITGPRLLGDVYNEDYLPSGLEEIKTEYEFDSTGNYITVKGSKHNRVVNYHNGEYRRLSDSDGACNYEKMYFARIVYGEGECGEESLQRALKALGRRR